MPAPIDTPTRPLRPDLSLSAGLAWLAAGVIFAAPLVAESLALQSAGASDRSGTLVIASLVVAGVTALALALFWRKIVTDIGNAGLATIALVAGLQFAVSYAARLVGYVVRRCSDPCTCSSTASAAKD